MSKWPSQIAMGSMEPMFGSYCSDYSILIVIRSRWFWGGFIIKSSNLSRLICVLCFFWNILSSIWNACADTCTPRAAVLLNGHHFNYHPVSSSAVSRFCILVQVTLESLVFQPDRGSVSLSDSWLHGSLFVKVELCAGNWNCFLMPMDETEPLFASCLQVADE